MKLAVITLAVLLVAFLIAYWQRHEIYRRLAGLPEFTVADFTEETVMVPMRDGVKLSTAIFRPAGVDKAPTIFVRNPYKMLRNIERLQCGALARLGYACVVQDVRGMMDSEGDWYPIIHERDDGLDAMKWLVAQPWHDGNIGMRGVSYLACVQWAIADELPPEVKTLVPSMFGTDLRQVFYERGLFRHEILTAWAMLMPDRGMHHFAGYDYLKAAAHRPAMEIDEKFIGKRVDWYRDLLHAQSPDAPFWSTPEQLTFRATPEKTKVPMLFVAGFFEPFFATHKESWDRLATQKDSVFLVGPWNHITFVSGDYEGPAPKRLSQWPIMFEWFEHHLKGKPLTTLTPGTVRLWGIGDEGWHDVPQWPQAQQTMTVFPLGRASAAQGCEGGSLGEAEFTEWAKYRFDPANPVPTRGGAALLSFAFFRYLGFTPGPLNQLPDDSCAREDVLTFRSAIAAKPQRLSGAAKLKLRVTSTAPDTAFVARLIAEQDGKALLVREAAATLAWPTANTTEPQRPETRSPTNVEIDFWPIEWTLPAGGRWRLDITSSSFPALQVHSNRATPWETEGGFDVADQAIQMGASQLELPLY